MDLKQLKYFVTAVDEGSISAASRRLFMSQPPLSAQLKSLERELGCVLFERGSRSIELTEAGRMLYLRAQTMLEMERVARDEIAEMRGVGTVRLGAVSSVLCSGGEKWIAGFSEKNPKVRFEITEGNTYSLIEKLKSHTISLAVLRTPFADAEGMVSERLFTDKIVAVGKERYFGDGELDNVGLSRLPLIIYRRWEKIITDALASHGIGIDYSFICDDARTTVRFAECGLGVALVPSSAALLITDGDTVTRSLSGVDIVSDVVLMHSASGVIPEAAKRFADHLRSLYLNS